MNSHLLQFILSRASLNAYQIVNHLERGLTYMYYLFCKQSYYSSWIQLLYASNGLLLFCMEECSCQECPTCADSRTDELNKCNDSIEMDEFEYPVPSGWKDWKMETLCKKIIDTRPLRKYRHEYLLVDRPGLIDPLVGYPETFSQDGNKKAYIKENKWIACFYTRGCRKCKPLPIITKTIRDAALDEYTHLYGDTIVYPNNTHLYGDTIVYPNTSIYTSSQLSCDIIYPGNIYYPSRPLLYHDTMCSSGTIHPNSCPLILNAMDPVVNMYSDALFYNMLKRFKPRYTSCWNESLDYIFTSLGPVPPFRHLLQKPRCKPPLKEYSYMRIPNAHETVLEVHWTVDYKWCCQLLELAKNMMENPSYRFATEFSKRLDGSDPWIIAQPVVALAWLSDYHLT